MTLPEARRAPGTGPLPTPRRTTANHYAPPMANQTVEMYLLHGDTPRDRDARAELAAALGDGVTVSEADDVGVFEVALEADDREAALSRVWDAVAASGTDDHIVFLEHPDLPQHWHRVAGGPNS